MILQELHTAKVKKGLWKLNTIPRKVHCGLIKRRPCTALYRRQYLCNQLLTFLSTLPVNSHIPLSQRLSLLLNHPSLLHSHLILLRIATHLSYLATHTSHICTYCSNSYLFLSHPSFFVSHPSPLTQQPISLTQLLIPLTQPLTSYLFSHSFF